MSDTNSNFQMQAANAGDMTVNRLEIGDALGSAIRLFRSNLGSFLLMSLAVTLLATTIYSITGPTEFIMTEGTLDVVGLEAAVSFGLLSMILFLLLYVLVQAVALSAALTAVRGMPPTFGDALREGLRSAPKLFGISILFSLGYLFLSLFLWIPGLIFVIVFFVVKSAALAEGLGVLGAFGRARELSRNNRWPIVGAVFLMSLVIGALLFVYALVLGAILGGVFAVTGMGATLSAGVAVPMMFAFHAFPVCIVLILMTCLDATIYHGLATPHALDRTEASRVFD
ncbi:MAG: hypothetical protein RJQ21_12065 [Rhodospirillales bacterium]